MLSAPLTTNAIPRRIHIVPSVMMNGWTRRPTTISAVDRAADEPDGKRHGRARAPRVATGRTAPRARSTIAIATPASA